MALNEIEKQGIINRLADNSFKIKSWAVATIPLVLAGRGYLPATLIFVLMLFWYLDGYYLAQERMFRGLKLNYVKAIFSRNLILLYGVMISIVSYQSIEYYKNKDNYYGSPSSISFDDINWDEEFSDIDWDEDFN